MPKVVDHARRRAQIGWAVARLIEQQGVQAVSVRAVAAVAGYQPSTLRHYFPSSDQMLAHALVVVRDRQQQRLAAMNWPDDPRSALRDAWLEALPLDATRLTEAHVWLAVSITARSEEARFILAKINERLDQLCVATIRVFTPHDDHRAAALALRAFTDGLALGAIAEPDRYTPTAMTDSLDTYLAELGSPSSQSSTENGQ